MHVIATAGHVDHGKSTLVKALTGHDPDRLAEEHERGLSIELGYCWATLPPVGDVAFVDVPGHERFISTMLAGIGPVPAVLLVVAADDPWMPQAAEHLAALDALGVRNGVVAVTRADLADPEPMMRRARQEVDATTLAGAPVVAVSAVTGTGLDELRDHLVMLVGSLAEPEPAGDVRLWVDRCFHVRGAGTVVTGTLPAGTVLEGDELSAGSSTYRVRGVQSLGQPVASVSGVARVALNLAGEDRSALDRHSVLVTPGAWWHTGVVDVRLRDGAVQAHRSRMPSRPLLHIGASAVPTYLRPLDDDHARLTLDRPLPLRIGDRALLRDPGSRRVWGVTVLDPAPPPLERRGAARHRSADLARVGEEPDGAGELERRGMARLAVLRQIGAPVPAGLADSATPDGWLLGAAEADRLRSAVTELVSSHEKVADAEPGLPLTTLAERLQLPSSTIVRHLVAPPMRLVQGRVTMRAESQGPTLAPELERAVDAVTGALARDPFVAPTADHLREVGLHPKAVVAAARAGRLLHLGDGIVLLPGADDRAVEELAQLEQPFTTSDARQRLGTTRRVILPLLSHLDRQGRTRRLPDDRRSVVRSSPA